jgi:hypothetical protein
MISLNCMRDRHSDTGAVLLAPQHTGCEPAAEDYLTYNL